MWYGLLLGFALSTNLHSMRRRGEDAYLPVRNFIQSTSVEILTILLYVRYKLYPAAFFGCVWWIDFIAGDRHTTPHSWPSNASEVLGQIFVQVRVGESVDGRNLRVWSGLSS